MKLVLASCYNHDAMISHNRLISVIMPVYNTPREWLTRAIESILAQTYEDLELIIVLDAPTDGSDVIAKGYADEDPRVRILENRENSGIIASLNRGLEEAGGQLIARMDADDFSYPERLEKELAYLEEHDLDLTGTRVRWIDDENKVKWTSPLEDDIVLPKILEYTNVIPHPTWFFRKELGEKLKGYRDIPYCEDYDFLLRALSAKAKIGMCDHVYLDYRIHESSISSSNDSAMNIAHHYIQDRYASSTLEEVDAEDVLDYIEKKHRIFRPRNYERADRLLARAKSAYKSRRALSSALLTAGAVLRCPYILRNIKETLLVDRIRSSVDTGSLRTK